MQVTQLEKKDLIHKLLKEGRSYRDITKIAHCSPNEIARVKREETIETNVNMKGKSICSCVFDSLQKGIRLPQIVIDHDIEPELVLKIQEKYLNLIGKGQIVSLLKNQQDVALIIDILGYLVENPHHRKKMKELVELQREIWEMMVDKSELENDIRIAKYLYEKYDSMLEKQRKCRKKDESTSK